ncbi:patatin-like phospholipase family protein [Candidatus Wolfebacteria bacterium]|nr:patatin-like phospholipase family protein [Candidatus Wolfebacteria bacterium]
MPKKIGLALGGGGAKGLAHIGVIRELERENISISYIAGTSMGALVGGVYAATKDLSKLEEIFMNLTKDDVFPISKIIRKREGLFRDHSIIEHIEELMRGINIEQCVIPFRAITTDVQNGDQVILDRGSIVEAIRASVALPIAFKPIEIGGRLLMDGGFVNPVPADVCQAMGADVVIAVDVSSKWPKVYDDPHPIHGIYMMLAGALATIEYQIAKRILEKADVVLRPNVLSFGWHSFTESKEIIRAGGVELRAHLLEICAKGGYPEPVKTPFEKFMEFLFPLE